MRQQEVIVNCQGVVFIYYTIAVAVGVAPVFSAAHSAGPVVRELRNIGVTSGAARCSGTGKCESDLKGVKIIYDTVAVGITRPDIRAGCINNQCYSTHSTATGSGSAHHTVGCSYLRNYSCC